MIILPSAVVLKSLQQMVVIMGIAGLSSAVVPSAHQRHREHQVQGGWVAQGSYGCGSLRVFSVEPTWALFGMNLTRPTD